LVRFFFFFFFRMYYSGGTWYRPQASHATLLDKYWTKVPMGNMTREELKKVRPIYQSLSLFLSSFLPLFVCFFPLMGPHKYRARVRVRVPIRLEP